MINFGSPTLNLPTLKGREAARRKLEADVQVFLEHGGKIKHCPHGQSVDSIRTCAPAGTGKSRKRGSAKTGESTRIFWSASMLKILRRDFGKVSNIELAEQLGVTVSHLQHKAAHMGITKGKCHE